MCAPNTRLLDKILYAVVAAFILMFVAALMMSKPASESVQSVAPVSKPAESESAHFGQNQIPGLTLELVPEKQEYEIGETIPIKLVYRYTGTIKLMVGGVSFEHYGRTDDIEFFVSPEQSGSWRDPDHGRFSPTDYMFVPQDLPSGSSYEQTVPLNAWVCFETRGTYSLTVQSRLVSNDSDDESVKPEDRINNIRIISSPAKIRIVPFDEKKRAARVEELIRNCLSRDRDVRKAAVDELKFMIDERAIPTLATALGDEDPDIQWGALCGLYYFKNSTIVNKAVRTEIEKADPIRDKLLRKNSKLLLERTP